MTIFRKGDLLCSKHCKDYPTTAWDMIVTQQTETHIFPFKSSSIVSMVTHLPPVLVSCADHFKNVALSEGQASFLARYQTVIQRIIVEVGSNKKLEQTAVLREKCQRQCITWTVLGLPSPDNVLSIFLLLDKTKDYVIVRPLAHNNKNKLSVILILMNSAMDLNFAF